jgi:ankyrin repeat protein
MPFASSSRLRAAGLVLLGLLLCALAATRQLPVVWWLAMPALVLGLARWRLPTADHLIGRSGGARLALAGLLTGAAGAVVSTLVAGLWSALGHGAERLYPALAMALLLAALLLAQWRSWPLIGLLFLDALPASAAAPETSLWRRLREESAELTGEDSFFRHGLWAAGLQLLALLAPWLLARTSLEGPVLAALGCLLAGAVTAALLAVVGHARSHPSSRTHLPDFLLDGGPPADGDAALPELPPGPDDLLLQAARRGDSAGVRAALAAGADPDSRPRPEATDQRTPLIAAATAAELGALRALIAAGAGVDRDSNGLTALIAATRDSYDGRIEAVMTLLANGADPNRADEAGNTPLHFAALTRDAGVAQSLIDAGARIDAINREGLTPLAIACEAANWTVVEFLLKRGAAVHLAAASPALLAAAAVEGDDPRGVRLLLKAKAKVDARGPQGRTALMVAALADNAEIAETLLAAGADLDARDEAGQSALLDAARAGANRVLQRLVFHRPRAEASDAGGRGALHLAALSPSADTETVRLLLALGCAAEALDGAGQSAAELAAAAGRWPLVGLLDPAYPLPSSHLSEGGETVEHEDSIAPDPPGRLLVRAALQGRYPLFQELLGLPGVAPADIAEAVRAALPLADRRYLDAVLEHGIDPMAREGGHSLFEILSAERPTPLAALEVLLDRAGHRASARAVLLPALAHWSAAGEQAAALREKLLDLAPDPDARDPEGRPALTLAVAQLPADWIERLLDNGVDPNAADGRGETALTRLAWAQRSDAPAIAALLVRAGADPAQATRDGSTAAGIARMTGQFELAQLLDWPAGSHPRRPLDGQALATAARRGDEETVRRLLALGIAVDAPDEAGASALLHACGNGHGALAAELMRRGADPRRPARNGVCALAAAIIGGRSEIVEQLLDSGLDRESLLLQRYTPLALAAGCQRTALVDFLLRRGADPDGRRAPVSPLLALLPHMLDPARPAAALEALLLRLIEARANPDQPGPDQRTPLHGLCGAGLAEPVCRDEARLRAFLARLIGAGANPNLADGEGRTALHWACRHGLVQMGAALLESGADPRVSDHEGRLPIDLLATRHRIHLGPALRQAAEAWNRQGGERRGG